ncbi:hypothetical protein Hanom_Chr16g01446781 [Helianthus anomalus]
MPHKHHTPSHLRLPPLVWSPERSDSRTPNRVTTVTTADHHCTTIKRPFNHHRTISWLIAAMRLH